MSRIGKQPIEIPQGVTVSVDGNIFTAKSSKGLLQVPFSEKMKVTVEGKYVSVNPLVEEKKINALWGLYRALIKNAIQGVHTGWSKVLEVRGVGYRALLKGKKLDLSVGHSHPIELEPPKGITFETGQEMIEGENILMIIIKGVDKQLVGDIAAKIRAYKPPEPYKGKGIRYHGEYVRKKAGKATG